MPSNPDSSLTQKKLPPYGGAPTHFLPIMLMQYSLHCRPPLPTDMIRTFLGIHPDAAGQKNSFGYIPLFDAVLACLKGLSPDVVSMLFDKCPEAASTAAKHGSIPLHLAGNVGIARMLMWGAR